MLLLSGGTAPVQTLPAVHLSCRRRLLLSSLASFVYLPLAARADESTEQSNAGAERWSVAGTATLRDNGALELPSTSALYLTARPKGGLGPVAAKRIPLSGRVQFPLAWELSESDKLPDAPPFASWSTLQLLVSARLDTDGVAATRDPDDLVGRGEAELASRGEGGAWRPVEVRMQGRGLAGRLVTQRDR